MTARRPPRFVVEVDKATLNYINQVRDRHNAANPGAGWRQKDTVRYLAGCHRAAVSQLADAVREEAAS